MTRLSVILAILSVGLSSSSAPCNTSPKHGYLEVLPSGEHIFSCPPTHALMGQERAHCVNGRLNIRKIPVCVEKLPLTAHMKTTYHNTECTEEDKTHRQTYIISVLSQAQCVKDKTCSLKEQAALCKPGKKLEITTVYIVPNMGADSELKDWADKITRSRRKRFGDAEDGETANCAEGQGVYDDSCVECPAGTYMRGEVCEECPQNSYTALSKQTVCIQCEDGKRTLQPGSDSADDCTFNDVVRDVYIPWNPDSEDIIIHTNIEAGSGDMVVVQFWDDIHVGGMRIWFKVESQILYAIGSCSGDWLPFPVSPPSEINKTWKISYSPAEKSLLIYCNEVEVLNVVLSDSVCTRTDFSWKDSWEQGDPTKIKILSEDTASDGYSITGKIEMEKLTWTTPTAPAARTTVGPTPDRETDDPAACYTEDMGTYSEDTIVGRSAPESPDSCIQQCSRKPECRTAVSSPESDDYRECILLSAKIETITARAGWSAASKNCFGGEESPGEPGDPGDVGMKGEQGDFGYDGPEGHYGENGNCDAIPGACQGETGDQGPSGDPGERGDYGADGADGLDGYDGADGAPGAQGVNGPRGETGIKGESGDIGEDGDTAESNCDGSSRCKLGLGRCYGKSSSRRSVKCRVGFAATSIWKNSDFYGLRCCEIIRSPVYEM